MTAWKRNDGVGGASRTAAFTHEALFYGSTSELVTLVAPFLRDGLDSREDVVLACSDPTSHAFSESLGADPRVTFLAQDFCSRIPSAIGLMQRLLRERLAAGASRVRLVVEISVGDDDRNWKEWARVEAACNKALASLPLWNVCAYDSRTLPEEVLADAELTHPRVRRGPAPDANPLYVEPEVFLALTRRHHVDPVEATEPAVGIADVDDLARARREIRAALHRTGADPASVEDFVVATNEVIHNALRHGRRPVTVRAWVTDRRLVGVVTDRGTGLPDPFAVYDAPGEGSLTDEGMGLWLVRQLCHEFTADHRPEGFTVRLSVKRRPGG